MLVARTWPGLAAAAVAAVLTALGSGAAAEVAAGDTSQKRIALSNSFIGNAWRRAMVDSWTEAAEAAVAQGRVAAAPAFTTTENQAVEQAAQIRDLTREGFDAIVINAASPTGLNDAVREACDAGVVVVSFDSIVTEPCAWRLVIDFAGLGEAQLDYLGDRLGDGGNVLEVRGLAGVFVDDEIHAGVARGFERHPGLTRVGEVHADWTQTVAQREVAAALRELPPVDAVVTQGGDGLGTALAFRSGGREQPVIVMSNRHDELQWWRQQRDASGYETISLSIPPAASQVAFWVAQQILAGRDVPKDLLLPTLVIRQNTLDFWLEHTPPGGVANATYPLEWVSDLIDTTIAGAPPPPTPAS
ncbi:MAG: ABC transporter substrate-binding protein [Alphaproteobacteria bacterium]